MTEEAEIRRSGWERLCIHLAKSPVYVYRYILSPILPGTCRFQPSCSAYAIEAIDRFGPISGSILALKRLARCHPWGRHGIDPVPDHLDGSRPDV